MNTELCDRFPEGFEKFKNLYKDVPGTIIDFQKIEGQVTHFNDMLSLVNNVRNSFVEYLEVLLTFDQLSQKEKTMEERLFAEESSRVDEWRRISHNAMIANVNILVRNMRKRELDVSWFTISSPDNRIAYGKLALKTAFNELCTCTGA
jgi:hypothetical protein